MNKKLKNLIKIFFGLAIFLIIYFKIGILKIIKTISSMDALFLIPVLAILFLSYIISSVNLKILTSTKCEIPIFTMLKYYTLSWAFGSLSPGKIGEFSLMYFLKKHKLTLGEGLAISLIDKIITLLVLAIFSIFGFLVFFGGITALKVLLILIITFVVGIFAVTSQKLRKAVRKYLLRKYEKNFKGFFKLFKGILLNKKIVALNVSLTALKWILSSVIVFILFLSFRESLSLSHIIMINSTTLIISLIPITINGLGIREGSAIYLYSLIGVDLGITASVYLLLSFINYIIAGLCLTLINYRGFRVE